LGQGQAPGSTIQCFNRPAAFLSGLGQDPATKAKIKDFEKRFSFPFWNLPEGKIAKENADGSVTFVINGVTIHMLPDKFLTEEEYQREGGTFEHDGPRGRGKFAAARTSRWLVKTDFDVKSIKTSRTQFGVTVDDYQEPTFEIAIQVRYRKTRAISTLAKARRLSSGYGKGKTLREHENWHVSDTIDYIKKYKPTLPEMRGVFQADFNEELKKYYTAVSSIATTISAYSRHETDCSVRKAFFCD
jgi:hypothetical protein